MKYYQHNIGDYDTATKHLTMLEHGAYRQLLDLYYVLETPLPPDLDKICRLIGAKTAAQKKAVEQVLNEFFERNSSGWNNKRADTEISRYKAKAENAKKSASSRWSVMRTHSEGIANAVQTHSDGNANHKPITNNQEKKESSRGASAPAKEYVWEGSVIQLNARDYGRWKNFFRAIPDFDAELATADAYYRDNPPKGSWFHAVSRWLKKAHEEGLRREKEEYNAKHSWN
jgi:uncharacterized protein YdaU (DUF1376 family)